MKIGFIVEGDNHKFLRNIIGHLEREHEVRICIGGDEVADILAWADVSWVEWVQDLAVKVSKMPRRGKLVLRLNCYEAHTSIPADVAWENVDRLFVVSESVLTVLELRISGLEERVCVDILHSGVDMNLFGLKDDFAPTGKVAFVGSLGHTKNLPLLMQCFNVMVLDDPELTLHVAGAYTGTELERIELAMYLSHMVAGMGLEGRVSFYGHVDDVSDWLEDKDYLISTSLREGIGYQVLEAMAKGVSVAVHAFPGARRIFPPELVFYTAQECRDILFDPPLTPKQSRAYVTQGFSLDKQIAKLDRILVGLVSDWCLGGPIAW